MPSLTFTVDQVTNLAKRIIAEHGLAVWEQCEWDGQALVVPDDLAAIVTAVDADEPFVPTGDALIVIGSRVVGEIANDYTNTFTLPSIKNAVATAVAAGHTTHETIKAAALAGL